MLRNKKKDIIKAYQHIFDTPDGQTVLQDLISCYFLLQPNFSNDARLDAFREGQRNVLLKILHHINFDTKDLDETIKKIEQEKKDGYPF